MHRPPLARFALLSAAAATLSVGVASTALAAVSYLSQLRIVEASVGATVNFDPALTDMERRASMDGGDFDRTASVDVRIPGDPDILGIPLSSGGARATTTQVSSLTDSGIVARFTADLVSGDDLLTRPVATVGNLLETTFVLDGPHRYEFFPAGRTGTAFPSSFSEGSVTANGTLVGPGIDFDESVKFLGNLMLDPGVPLVGILPGGEYTFRYVLEDRIPEDTDGGFTSSVELNLTALDDGGNPAVVPLPGAATAGLLTLAGLGVARARERRGA